MNKPARWEVTEYKGCPSLALVVLRRGRDGVEDREIRAFVHENDQAAILGPLAAEATAALAKLKVELAKLKVELATKKSVRSGPLSVSNGQRYQPRKGGVGTHSRQKEKPHML